MAFAPCDFLTIQIFLSKQNGQYSVVPKTAAFLNRNSQTYLGGGIEFLLNPRTRDAFDSPTESVRKGGSALEHTSVEPENPMWIAFAHSMLPMMYPIALAAASTVALPDDRDSKVLDVAASHGILGIAFAQRHPRAHIVGLDWKNVLELTRENANRFGVADRYSTIVGDAFTQEFGTDYDLILLPNFLHHFDIPHARSSWPSAVAHSVREVRWESSSLFRTMIVPSHLALLPSH